MSLSRISYLFIYLFSSESYVKLLISTKCLEKEKEEAIKELLTVAVHDYLKFNDHSGDSSAQAVKSFTEYLINVYGISIVTVGMSNFYSLYLILRSAYSSVSRVVCQQYRMQAKSNNRKIFTTVHVFILKCKVYLP